MESPIEAKLDRHDAAIREFIARARRLSPAQALAPRAPGKWSPAQEAAHLYLTCSEYRAVLEGGPEFELMVAPNRAAFYRDTVLPRVLAGGWFPSGATAPRRVEPPVEHAMTEILADLEIAEELFHDYARAAYAAEPGRQWVHPYFGPMSLPDLVDLLTEHVRHHAAFLPHQVPG